MESLRMTKILILIVLLFVGCKKNNPQSCSKDNCTEQTCLNETKNNEIEKIIHHQELDRPTLMSPKNPIELWTWNQYTHQELPF